MCAGIIELSNALIYGNRLRFGSLEIAEVKLKLASALPNTPWVKEKQRSRRNLLTKSETYVAWDGILLRIMLSTRQEGFGYAGMVMTR
ncbi:hypothetical protein FRX31_003836, partial [Thalictrum thalictroides]